MEREALREWYFMKLAMMAIFIFGDLFVNSKAEYEALEVKVDEGKDLATHASMAYEEMSQLQIILFGCSILLQASIFSAFFLILVDTFPFQVGMGVVSKEFKHMLIFQVLYSLMTIIVGAIRLVSQTTKTPGMHFTLSSLQFCQSLQDQVFKGNTDIWSNVFYVILSFIHKLGEPMLQLLPPFRIR